MKSKLFKKQFFITATIIVLSLVILVMILSVVLNNHITKSSYDTLSKCCNQISENVEDFTESDTFSAIAVPLSEVSKSDIFVTDSHGAILMCACDEWQENGKCMHSSYIVPKKLIDRSSEKNIFAIDTMDMFKFPQYVSVKAIGEDGEFFVSIC